MSTLHSSSHTYIFSQRKVLRVLLYTVSEGTGTTKESRSNQRYVYFGDDSITMSNTSRIFIFFDVRGFILMEKCELCHRMERTPYRNKIILNTMKSVKFHLS